MLALWMATLRSPCNAATKPTVHRSTITTNVPITQSIKFQRHPQVSITNNAVSGRLTLATKDLQTKDGPTDVSCPVKLSLSGSVSQFTDPNPNSILDIESEQDISDLFATVDLDTNAALVRRITFCTTPGAGSAIKYGCTLGTLLMIFSNDAEAPWDQTTAAHEFGHYRGLNHVGSQLRIMNENLESQAGTGNEDHVTSGECNAFKNPI